MHLTRYTDYSLRVLMYLGINSDRLVTITDISAAYDISRNHLVKVVHKLGRQGYIQTYRGKHGGMRLARAAEEINLGEVVRQMEESLEIIKCDDPPCSINGICKLKDVLREARDAFLLVLDGYSLADLLGHQHEQLTAVLKLEGLNR